MMLQKEEKYEGVGKVKVNFEKQSFENEGLQIGRKALTQFKKYIEKKRNSAE